MTKSVFQKILSEEPQKPGDGGYPLIYGAGVEYRNLRRAELARTIAVAEDDQPLQSYTKKNMRWEYEGLDPQDFNPNGRKKAAEKTVNMNELISMQHGADIQLNEICNGVQKYQ